jgi:putative ABC transport system permease protein
MLITVKERTKEIGVRKALGASPLSIVAMVMKESVVLTLIAGLLGVAAGTALLAIGGSVFQSMPDSPMGPPLLSFTTVMAAVAVLIASGAAAGIMPAAHAASIRPIEALRTE